MVIPSTTQNQAAAEEWINYIYDRANYAKLVAYIQYIPVLADMTDDLARIDPALADDPLINPPPEIWPRSRSGRCSPTNKPSSSTPSTRCHRG